MQLNIIHICIVILLLIPYLPGPLTFRLREVLLYNQLCKEHKTQHSILMKIVLQFMFFVYP